MSEQELSQRKCKACEGGVSSMNEADIVNSLEHIPGWAYDSLRLTRSWKFKNHYQAMALVNAIAYISHTENHHPYITIGYNDVKVDYWTHAIDGISENDFICAAKVNLLDKA
ncbi:MAG: 4a-hydroxytetrahydrobiopterin dehydratase [Lentisphaeraceae bacterium]|nr:4a-hydroxytetrahydrobiopterin dehydratase [Lentisphaeraceae bacterium]